MFMINCLTHSLSTYTHTHILWFGVWMSSIIDLPCSVMCIWSKDGLKGRRRDYTYEATEAGIKTTVSSKALISKRSQRHTLKQHNKMQHSWWAFWIKELGSNHSSSIWPATNPQLHRSLCCVVFALPVLWVSASSASEWPPPLGTLRVLRRHVLVLDLAGCSCLQMLPEMVPFSLIIIISRSLTRVGVLLHVNLMCVRLYIVQYSVLRT